MKYCGVFRYSLSVFLIWASVIPVWAQETKPIINASLAGTVIDAITKDPIEGATVQLEAVTHSVKTDRNGSFSFVTGQKLPFKLTVTSVGYATQNLVIEKSSAVIELHRSTEDLDEVVVVGYTTIAKKNLIGAVDRVSQQAVKDIPTGSFDAQLQGKVAGMQVARSEEHTSELQSREN